MTKPAEIQKAINDLIQELVDNLERDLTHCIESITLVGSYPIGKISLERPNVNLLIFTKPSISAKDHLELGEIFYKTSKKYLDYFSIKIDSLPFRTGTPIGQKKLQLVLAPNILNMTQKNNRPPFGVPSNVLEGMVATRKVVFGSDPLAEVDIKHTKQDIIQWAFFDIGILFRNQLMRAPLSYDVDEHPDLLADEALEIGKIALMWGAEIFMGEKDWQQGKHTELIKDKEKILAFYQGIDKKLAKSAKIILEARTNFQDYKTNKKKTFELYNAAYLAIFKVFSEVMSQRKK